MTDRHQHNPDLHFNYFNFLEAIPPDGTKTEDLRCISREELATLTDITPAQLPEEISI